MKIRDFQGKLVIRVSFSKIKTTGQRIVQVAEQRIEENEEIRHYLWYIIKQIWYAPYRRSVRVSIQQIIKISPVMLRISFKAGKTTLQKIYTLNLSKLLK